MGAKRKNINVNDRFNFLTVVKEINPYITPSNGEKIRRFLTKCDCGNLVEINRGNLTSGTQKSCGCMKSILISERHKKHGMWTSPEYNSWRAMKARCLNSKHKQYFNYGGRGIKICEEWVNSFEEFIKSMGKRPTIKHSLDRIDNNGNYEPSNCRWSTPKQQANNRK